MEPIVRPGPLSRPPGAVADSIGDRAVLEAFDQAPVAFDAQLPTHRVGDVVEGGPTGNPARLSADSSSTTAPPPDATAGTSTAPEAAVGGDAGYQRRLGERLRTIRRTHGMRLQDVEERSGGRFKAVVIGSYERGDRAIATHKLAALAAFYGVPIGELLPDDGWPDPAPVTSSGIRLSVPAVQEAGDDPESVALRRVVQHVRVLRGDHHGRVLTLRGDDLRTVAVTLGVDVSELPDWLQARGLLASR